MHELSIALGIVDMVEAEVKKNHASAVEKVELEIGALSGVEIDALEFAWPMAIKNSSLQKAILDIHHIKGWAKCGECGQEFEQQKFYDPCPVCQNYFIEILKGKELKIKSLTII